ncbi:hypothetical protein L6452_37283 [Arctium lappa]|uniref:Uncharacterized protein n=1 Tax=Arctium lappa TaxID=4217 RepID=A0ACB8Y321_ARCLA|nr:hypothetical protein L6452_37283 [Arctium lappa]
MGKLRDRKQWFLYGVQGLSTPSDEGVNFLFIPYALNAWQAIAEAFPYVPSRNCRVVFASLISASDQEHARKDQERARSEFRASSSEKRASAFLSFARSMLSEFLSFARSSFSKFLSLRDQWLASTDKMTSRDAFSIGTDVKPVVLFKGEYEQWKDRFLDFVDRYPNGENLLLSIKEGPMELPTVEIPDNDSSDSEDGDEDREQKMKTVPKDFAQYSEEQKNRFNADKKARSLLLQSNPNDIYIKIDSYKANAKKMWDQLQKMMMGSKVGNQMKVANCKNSYEEFKAKEDESLEDSYERFVLLLNELSNNKVKKKQIENNVKFLSILQPEWKKHTRRMKQMKDLSDIPLHEVYETLRQNEEEVEEKRSEKKKVEKVPDPIALVAGEKEKEKKEKKKKKKVITSSESESESDGDDGESLKQAMLLLTRAFQKKFYKKPGFNSQRYSSSSSKNHEHRERVEGNRFVDKKLEERKKYVNDYTAKQQEAGIALMAEDEFWLDHSDVEEEKEKEESAHLCLMGKEDKEDDSDEETADEVINLTEHYFLTKMEAMMVELQDLQVKLKKEKDRVAR